MTIKCNRCESNAVTSTRGENFCAECFQIFISRKFRASMGDFRVNGALQKGKLSDGEKRSHKQKPPGAPPLITVFVSYGICSLALVDLLLDMQQAQKMKNNGMCGFDIQLVNIGNTPKPSNFKWPWPEHIVKEVPLPNIDEFLNTSLKLSRSSSQDLEDVLFRQSALALALSNHTTAIFGYSLTRLSELTLAETIKGRGASIPNIVSPDIHKNHCVYPLKDITHPEIEEYCKIKNISCYAIEDPKPPTVTKMQSIDEIVHQYFTSVQSEFPSVVSTVSKVASRLSQPAEECALCNPKALTDSTSKKLCYACSSATQVSELNKSLDLVKQFEI